SISLLVDFLKDIQKMPCSWPAQPQFSLHSTPVFLWSAKRISDQALSPRRSRLNLHAHHHPRLQLFPFSGYFRCPCSYLNHGSVQHGNRPNVYHHPFAGCYWYSSVRFPDNNHSTVMPLLP